MQRSLEERKLQDYKINVASSLITADDSLMSEQHAPTKIVGGLNNILPDLNSLFHLSYNFDNLKKAIEFLA